MTQAIAFLRGEGFRGKKAREESIRKIVSYAPEVMVKVTGFSKSPEHMKTHLDYISRDGHLPLEDELGHVLTGKDEIKDLFKDWKSQENHRASQQNNRYTTHLVLSMPEGTDERILQNAVRAFARKTFSNHRYVMALHLDTNHPHVHLTVQNAGFNRRKLQIKRGDPQSWREVFAHELDKRGIEAEATPRAVRGVVLKSTVQVLKHMKARGVRLYSAKMTESIRQAWTHPTPRPWEKTIKDNQASLRAKWLELAATYASTDKNLSNKIKQFVDNMPLPLTKREMINQKIFHSIRDKTQAHKLMHDHPELKQDIAIIHKAETIAKHKYTNQEQQEHFIQKIINHVAHKRLQGQGIALMKEKEKDFER